MAFLPRVFEKPQLMTWNNNKITDHNRSELSVDVERIEEKARMANGTMRKYIVADKRTFSCSWDDLPHSKDFTVDGFWGKREIEKFYNDFAGGFTLRIYNGDGKVDTFTVMMSDFSAELSKRGAYDFWSVSVEMEEV
jgi:hypothetical protein